MTRINCLRLLNSAQFFGTSTKNDFSRVLEARNPMFTRHIGDFDLNGERYLKNKRL